MQRKYKRQLTDKQLSQSLYIASFLTLFLPPFFGGSIMAVAGFYPLPEYYLIFTNISAPYVLFVIGLTLLFIPYAKKRIINLPSLPPEQLSFTARQMFTRLPLYLWLAITIYSVFGILSADISMENMGYANYTLRDHLIHQFGIIPVVMITSFPVFFYFIDRIGLYLGPRGVHINAIPIWIKIFMLGIVTPLLIDTLLIGYFYNRTGYFEIETFAIWLFLLALAGGGTWLAWLSMQQGLMPLQTFTESGKNNQQDADQLLSFSLDELGLLTARFAELTKTLQYERDYANDIINTAPVIILMLDSKGYIQQVNPWFESLTGYAQHEILGKEWFSTFLPVRNQDKIRKLFYEASHDKPTSGNIHPIVTRHGEEKEIEWYAQPMRENEQMISLLYIGLDVTERLKTEQMLKRQQAILLRSEELSHVGSWEWDIDNNELTWSPEMYRLYNIDASSTALSFDLTLANVHPDDIDSVKENFENLLSSDISKPIKFRLLDLNKNIRHIHSESIVSHDKQGNPVHMYGFVQDITEQDHMYERIQMFQRLVEVAGQGIGWAALDSTILYFNKALQKLLAIPNDVDITQYSFNDFYTEKQLEELETVIIPQILQEGYWTGEYDITSLNGKITPTIHNVFLIHDQTGKPIAFANVITDISEQKHTEKEIQRLASIVKHSPDFIGISDIEGNALFLNEAGRKLVGIEDDKHFYSTKVPDYFSDEDRDQVVNDIIPALMSEGGWQGEIHFKNFQSGDLIPMWFDIFRIDDPKSGLPTNFATVSQDITELKNSELALRESEARYRRAEEGTNDGLWEWNVVTGDDYFSPRWLQMLGYQPGELAYHIDTFTALLHPEDKNRIWSAVNTHFEKGIPFDVEMRLRHKEGHYLWMQSRGQIQHDENGQPILMTGFITNITQRKQAEEELTQYREHLEELVEKRTIDIKLARDEAEHANAAKTEFLSRMSHELRTPLNAIIGFSELMRMDQEHPLDESHSDHLHEIQQASHNLLTMVNEILDLSRIESGRLDINLEPIELKPVLTQCVKQCEPLAKQRNISIIADFNNDSPYMLADLFRLKQILTNLLSNAIKYNNDNGKIWVICKPSLTEKIRISVTDTGKGIPHNELDTIFKPFERLESAYNGIEGTGIGLALVKKLVEEMNGEIGVESSLDEGSTFWFELPKK